MSGWKDRRGSAHSRRYGAAWRKCRAAVLRRDMRLCQPCLALDRTTQAEEVDHITNKAAGGRDGMENLQAICVPCHIEKDKREARAANSKRPVVGLDGWPIEQGDAQ